MKKDYISIDLPERTTRKFKEKDFYREPEEKYYLLPFRFININNEKELLVNEIGDFILVPVGTAEKVIKRQISIHSDKELHEDLLAGFFISDTLIPDIMPLLEARYRTQKSFLDEFTSLHIFVISLRCEHTCHYCQVSRVTKNKSVFDMSTYHIDKGIEIMLQSPSNHLTMEFQGGEALLAFDKIVYAVEKTKHLALQKGKKISYVICTNLAPLHEDMLPFIMENNIMISTSLDGPEFIHNKNRHRPGNNSYQLTIQGIEHCRRVLGEERVSALLTTTSLSLEFPNEIVEEYVARGFRNIFLRPISPYGFANYNPKKNYYETERFLNFYKKAFERILEYNRSGYFIREDYATIILKKILTPFPVGYVDLQSPAGLINSVVVFNYDGRIYASDEARMLAEMKDYTFQLGVLGKTTYNEVFYGEKALAIAEVWSNETLAGCSECAFQSYCGADPVHHHATQGDMYGHRPTSTYCQKNMEIIRYLFELMDNDPANERIFRSWITGYQL